MIVGLCWVGVFRVTWRLFGDPENTRVRLIPTLAVVALECAVLGRGLVLGLARSLDERDPQRGGPPPAGSLTSVLTLVLTVAAYWALLAGIPDRIGWYPSHDDWRSWFNVLYPRSTYRPMLLAPVWGRWAILLAAGVGRAATDADPLVRGLSAAVRPGRVLLWAIVPIGLTALYTAREGPGRLFQGLLVTLLVMLVTYVAAVLFARRRGGQDADTICAAATIAQLAFLTAYRALCVGEQ